MKKVRQRVFLSILAGLMALGVSACGSSGTGTTSAASTSVKQSANAPHGSPITLVSIAPITGPLQFPWVPDGAKAAANSVNAAGGIDGHPVRIVVCDEKLDPNANIACGREAVSDKALAAVGTLAGGGDGYAKVLSAAGIPDVGVVPNYPINLTDPLAFPIVGATQADMIAAPQLCKRLGATTIKVAVLQFPESQALVKANIPIGLKLAGLQAATVTYPTTQTDYAPVAASLMSGGTNCITGVPSTGSAALITQALRQAGYTGVIIWEAAVIQSNLKSLGAAAKGLYLLGSVPAPSVTSPGMKEFFAEEKSAGFNQPVADWTQVNSWVAVHLIANVMKGVPNVQPSTLVARLRASGPEDLAPAVPFNLSRPSDLYGPGVHLYTNQIFVSRVGDGGQIQTLFGGKPIDAGAVPTPPAQ
jgi:ABC-type branched-subunit amino acid transport system substrate-binding protein